MLKKTVFMIIGVILILTGIYFVAGDKASVKNDAIEYVIGVSQANMEEPWRILMNEELQQEADKHSNIRVIFMDATRSIEKQKRDIDKLEKYGMDILVVSPCDADDLTPTIRQVYQNIPVIVMDRAIEGFDYTLYIGPDNENVGKKAGQTVTKLLGNSGNQILELCAGPESKASQGISDSFSKVISQNQRLTVKQLVINDETRDSAEATILQQPEILDRVDVIFAHNDYMALGAANVLKEIGNQHIKIVGVDGFFGKKGGIDLVQKGIIAATITRPTGGKEVIQYAIDILQDVRGVPKQVILRNHIITPKSVDQYVMNSSKVQVDLNEADGTIVVGYAQLGTESAWRLANTNSIRNAAKDENIKLIFREANQSQEKQIESIRDFIELKVDVIVISPVVDNGWDNIFKEAKKAGIPIILSDRGTDIKDDSLYMTYIGADFVEEGRRAMKWIEKNIPCTTGSVNLLELQGTIGSSPMIQRSEGFRKALEEVDGYNVVYASSGDFTYTGGKKVVDEYLDHNVLDIAVIYAHNDDMALGAIDSLKAHGITPGVDVAIVSIDGTKEYFEKIIEGEANFSVECNPLLGPQLMKAVKDYKSGKELPLRIITEEKTYDKDQAKEVLRERLY